MARAYRSTRRMWLWQEAQTIAKMTPGRQRTVGMLTLTLAFVYFPHLLTPENLPVQCYRPAHKLYVVHHLCELKPLTIFSINKPIHRCNVTRLRVQQRRTPVTRRENPSVLRATNIVITRNVNDLNALYVRKYYGGSTRKQVTLQRQYPALVLPVKILYT